MREEERKKLAREIHDTLGQELTGFKIDLLWLKKQMRSVHDASMRRTLLDKIHSMTGLLDTMVKGIKKICLELRPGVLDLGLAEALEWQAREFERRSGLKCRLTISQGVRDLRLGAETSTEVFRIFQEIMTNVLRHAGATEVEVDVSVRRGRFVLEVSDNGRGIDLKKIAAGKSLGLKGMKERALLLGGEVEIRGRPEEGTRIMVRVPL